MALLITPSSSRVAGEHHDHHLNITIPGARGQEARCLRLESVKSKTGNEKEKRGSIFLHYR